MIKTFILSVPILISLSSIAQTEDPWWLRTPSNKVYEESHKYAFSEIEDGILKQEIKKFIETYITLTSKNKEEVAIEVIVYPENENREQIYLITYLSDYFEILSKQNNIQQVSTIDNRIIFFKILGLKDVKIKKQVLFGLLRKRYPNECKQLNESYQEFQEKGDINSVPTIIGSLEHNVPNLVISIKGDKILNKTLTFK